MKKQFFIPIFIFGIAFFATLTNSSFAQAVQNPKHKMAIFTPLYLDEAFNAAGNYQFGSSSFPKNTLPGLEFYHGAAMAIDSLNALNIPLNIYFYDSKSGRESLDQQFSKCAADGVELILANGSISDITKMAKLAAAKKITLINATVPNDGSATNNPYFVVVNSTLSTQTEGIYNYLKKHYPGKQLIFFTRKGGSSENYIRTAFETLNKQNTGSVIPIRYVEVTDTAVVTRTLASMDKSQPALFLAGSLDINFGANILKSVATLAREFPKVTVIGMPTWESINLNEAEFKGVEVIYSTPFHIPAGDEASRNIQSVYNKKMFARPSDLVYRGFGLTYRFARLLNLYGKDLNKNLESKEFRVFSDFNFQPVDGGGKLNYYENKKLYFLTYFNGSLSAVN